MTEIITKPSALRRPMTLSALLVLLDHYRFDHVILAVAALGRLGPPARLRTAPPLRPRLLVHHLGELVRRLGEVLRGPLDVVGAALLHRLARIADGALEIAHVRARDLVAVLVEHLFDLVDRSEE